MGFESELEAKELLKKDFVEVGSNVAVSDALKAFKNHDFEDQKSVYYVFVQDSDGFKGVVSVKELLSADKSSKIKEIISEDIVKISKNDNLEDVARLMSQYDFQALPVVEDNEIVGIVRLDEMLEVLDQAATEDIFQKAGILNISEKEIDRSEAVLNSSIFNEVKIRLPWLLFALVGGLIAGRVIEVFEASLSAVVTLAFFIPLIMDMGGNVGTQSSTIFVRGVVLGQIEESDVLNHVLKEIFSGGAIGFITGSLAGLAAYWMYGDIGVSWVLLGSMTFTCIFASFVGFCIPWLAHKTGRDPAAVSDPIITTIKDITALLIYFGFATLLLGI